MKAEAYRIDINTSCQVPIVDNIDNNLFNCLCSGWFTTQGIIYQSPYPFGLDKYLPVDLTPVEFKSLKHITFIDGESGFQKIDSRLLLEHLSDLKFRIDYIERDSAIPIKSIRA